MSWRRRDLVPFSWLMLAACSSNPSEPSPGSGPDAAFDLLSVVYVGGTTDEALSRLLDAAVKDDPRQYISVDTPDLSAPVAADAPAAFTFHLASQATHTPRAIPLFAPEPAWKRPLRELVQLLGPPRLAHAHGTPYNGTAYFVTFSDADGKALLRVFSAKPSYTSSPEAWQSLGRAKQPLQLDITSAYFEENDVPADGGPFVGGSFDFSIQ